VPFTSKSFCQNVLNRVVAPSCQKHVMAASAHYMVRCFFVDPAVPASLVW
jgi:hypothetical protein